MGATSRITKALVRDSPGLTGVQVLRAVVLKGGVSAVLTQSLCCELLWKTALARLLGEWEERAAGGVMGCMHLFIRSATQSIHSLNELCLSTSIVPGTVSGPGI